MVPGLLGALGLAFAARPHAGTVSAVENRPLAGLPRCDSVTHWFDGTCTREIDLYVADHFPGREQFVSAAFWMKAHRGIPREEEAPRVVEVRSMDEGWLERLEDWAPIDGGSVEAQPPAPAGGEAPCHEPLAVSEGPAPGELASCSAVADAGSAPGDGSALLSGTTPVARAPSEDAGNAPAAGAARLACDSPPGPAAVATGAPASADTPPGSGSGPSSLSTSAAGSTAEDPAPAPGAAPQPVVSQATAPAAESATPGRPPFPGRATVPPLTPSAALAAGGTPSSAGGAPGAAGNNVAAASGSTSGTNGTLNAAGVLPRPADKPAKVEVSNGILITGNRAMQLFGGTTQSAQAYAQVINAYAERLTGKVKVHSVVVPSAVSFHLPSDQAHRSRSERENLATLASALRPDISNPDTFPALQAHAADEPLYLRTDHHWNGLGAYRAYEAFCRSAGFLPVPLSAFTHGQKTGFLGSYAAFTQDASLRSAPDVVDHYDPPVTYTATRYVDADATGSGRPARFVDPQLRGYLVFLGGDAPLLHATTDVKNGRRAVLVKNSFGNAFAPLLLSHFEELYVVDYRYYAGSLDALVQKSGATDLIFFNVTLLANAAPHRQRIAVLGRGGKAWTHPAAARPDGGTPQEAGVQDASGEAPADAGE